MPIRSRSNRLIIDLIKSAVGIARESIPERRYNIIRRRCRRKKHLIRRSRYTQQIREADISIIGNVDLGIIRAKIVERKADIDQTAGPICGRDADRGAVRDIPVGCVVTFQRTKSSIGGGASKGATHPTDL